MLDEEISNNLENFHSSAYESHFGAFKTVATILRSSFYWYSLFKNAHEYVQNYGRYQHMENISKWSETPLNPILEIELFDMWGIDFMGPFLSSDTNQYVLVVVDYILKWVEAMVATINNARVVINFLKKRIYSQASALIEPLLVMEEN